MPDQEMTQQEYDEIVAGSFNRAVLPTDLDMENMRTLLQRAVDNHFLTYPGMLELQISLLAIHFTAVKRRERIGDYQNITTAAQVLEIIATK